MTVVDAEEVGGSTVLVLVKLHVQIFVFFLSIYVKLCSEDHAATSWHRFESDSCVRLRVDRVDLMYRTLSFRVFTSFIKVDNAKLSLDGRCGSTG